MCISVQCTTNERRMVTHDLALKKSTSGFNHCARKMIAENASIS